MADHKIKISGDFKELDKGFVSARKSLNELSKKKYDINIKKDTFRNIDKEIKTLEKDLKEFMRKTSDEANRLGIPEINAEDFLQDASVSKNFEAVSRVIDNLLQTGTIQADWSAPITNRPALGEGQTGKTGRSRRIGNGS